jgi:hypothetical protein
MKAAILTKINEPLIIINDIEIPELRIGQLLVKLKYSGVCQSQLMEARGLRGPDKYLPHLLGHEGVGKVVGIGEGITKVSIGDYVLTGGELPAMVVTDSIVRLIPGVLGGENSAAIESFSDGKTLEFPQYTRPEEFEGMKVPEVLLSGNHAAIEKWRTENSQQAATD